MKKFLMFLLGFVVGAVLCFVVVLIIGLSYNKSGVVSDGKNFSDTEVEYTAPEAFMVFQVLNTGDALAFEAEWEDKIFGGGGSYSSSSMVVLLLKEEGLSYYDEQIVKVPNGKHAIQVGVYRYQNNSGMNKTIPMISIK